MCFSFWSQRGIFNKFLTKEVLARVWNFSGLFFFSLGFAGLIHKLSQVNLVWQDETFLDLAAPTWQSGITIFLLVCDKYEAHRRRHVKFCVLGEWSAPKGKNENYHVDNFAWQVVQLLKIRMRVLKITKYQVVQLVQVAILVWQVSYANCDFACQIVQTRFQLGIWQVLISERCHVVSRRIWERTCCLMSINRSNWLGNFSKLMWIETGTSTTLSCDAARNWTSTSKFSIRWVFFRFE